MTSVSACQMRATTTKTMMNARDTNAMMTELRGGLLVDDDAIRLAVRLEDAGHVLSVKDGALLVSRGASLSTEDRAAIRAMRWHLLAIAAYEVPA